VAFLLNLTSLNPPCYARPIDEFMDTGATSARVWEKKPDWIDVKSNYWKLLQNPNDAGPKVVNWIRPEGDFRIDKVFESKIDDWHTIPIKSVAEVTNRSLMKETWESENLTLNILLPHPSSFDLIKYQLITDYVEWEKTPRGYNILAHQDKLTINGYPAQIFKWERRKDSIGDNICRCIVDLPRFMRIAVDQEPCSSTAVVTKFGESLRTRRLLEQLGISNEEKAKSTSPLVKDDQPEKNKSEPRLR
jgi:hypothetical protein